jgi:hypothetical protein
MENVEAIKNKITKLSLLNTFSSKYKAFGVAKISKNAMLKNINLYKKLSFKEKKVINYYTLIRKNIRKIDYRLLKSNKNHLCEANFQKDLRNFDLENV